MRLDGEAVTVCSRGPEGQWVAGLKRGGLGHFHGQFAAECSREGIVDWQRIARSEEDSRNEVLISRSVYCADAQSHFEIIMANPSRFTVGYALTAKKTKSFLQPKLEIFARSKGIVFVAVDRNRPLEEQGPFDVILHKQQIPLHKNEYQLRTIGNTWQNSAKAQQWHVLGGLPSNNCQHTTMNTRKVQRETHGEIGAMISGDGWHQQLKAYKQKHPEVVILDSPDSIKKVYNRQSMLQEVDLCNCRGRVGVPKQLVVTGDPASIPDRVAKAGLKFPLVAKPLMVDGTAKSHELSLAFNKNCLSDLQPPLVLQEFVNHGGVLFKVYVVGDIVKVVRRFSLPDVCEGEHGKKGVIPFPRVSCAAASAEEADLDPIVGELPPQEMLESLSRELRVRLGLSLFNLDMIRENGKGNKYYVIDINYLPGYGKMPDYEKVFTDFFLKLSIEKGK